MLRRNYSWLIAMMMLFTIVSCEYQTNDIYFRNVSKDVSVPDLTLNLNLASDTTYFYNSSYISLYLTLTNKTIYGVKFYINNVMAAEIQGYQNVYSIPIVPTADPSIHVKAEIYTSTETGSIADKLNAEAFVMQTREWVFINISENPVMTTEVIDGRLKTTWTPIKSKIKSKYYIYSTEAPDYLVDSTENNWYIDSSYVGGSNNYRVKYGKIDISGYEVYHEFNYPMPEVYVDNEDKYKISWDNCLFYNNIKGYRLKIDENTIDLPPTQESFEFKEGQFNKRYYNNLYYLIKKPLYDRHIDSRLIKSIYSYYRSSFLPESNVFSKSYFPLSGNTFYCSTRNNNQFLLNNISIDTKSVVYNSNFENDFSISPNNHYIIYKDDLSNFNLLQVNDFKQIGSVATSLISNFYGLLNPKVSDNGICLTFNNQTKSLIVYDILNNKNIAEIPSSVLLSNYKISTTGKYIFDPDLNALFKLGSNYYEVIWNNENTPNQFIFFEFSPSNEEKMYLFDGSTFFVKKSTDFSTENSFPLSGKTIINIDFASDKILSYADSDLYIYSLNTGKLLNKISTDPYLFSNNVILFNNYIISDHGQINLNQE